MVTLAVSPRTMEYLGQIEGQTTEEKVLRLLETYLSSQLMACEREIGEYEVKYRSTFAEFAGAWADGTVPDRRSHAVERDYMEWEGLEAEKRRWLDMLRRLPGNGRSE
ncbi:MAG: hypothetical protein HY784_14640 [Chloroflexi bacterium]|nr:hypothetical protein [Chloroflexota bacterium]